MSDRPGEPSATVLVVDDNLQNREVAEGHLVGAGYQALQAESGEEALALLRAGAVKPDLVLLDVLMPGLDGFETCRRIRALPDGSRLPILFLTALGDLGTHKAALDSGADDFLTKPINRTELLIRVRSLLRIKELSAEQLRNLDVISSQRDALVEAQRQKEELTALIIHDLKNPLSSILSNVQFALGQQSFGPDERESLRDVLRASQSMVRMVMNLLDISRSEDGALVPRCAEFDVAALLREISSETGQRLREKNQTLTIDVAAEAGSILADRDLVRRVIENLVDNSHKYSPRGGQITIAVSVPSSVSAPDGDPGASAPAVELRIRDQGNGIPVPYRTRIFEKYVRVEGRPEEPRNSQGLGLVFCRTAVEVHGGSIWVEDNGAGGSSFCVRLPRVARPQLQRVTGETRSPQLVAIASAG